MSDVIIKAENLSKYYKLGVINNGTFFKDMQTWMALKMGKPDPHSRIGENKYDPTKEGFWALKDLNFEIHQGDRVGIIGKNGAGKSTLLKILSRITAPTEGDVKIKGRVASLLEVGTGFHGELTGRENIFLNGAILGMKKREVQRKLDEIIAFSEIEQHIDTPVKRYSSGMYVRLAFAVAAHLDSEILIADEVLAVGDAAFQKKALGKMNDLSTGEGRTVLFVSHNMAQVKSLCETGILLEKGKLKSFDTLKNVIDLYFNKKDNLENQQLSIDCTSDNIGSVFFRPKQIAVLNSEGNTVNKDLIVSETYRIKLNFFVETYNSLTHCYFVFYDNDNNIHLYLAPKEHSQIKEGENEIILEIPPNILFPNTEYVISLAASVRNIEYIINPSLLDVAIRFTTSKEISFIHSTI